MKIIGTCIGTERRHLCGNLTPSEKEEQRNECFRDFLVSKFNLRIYEGGVYLIFNGLNYSLLYHLYARML